MIKKYNQFLNESILDELKGPTEEEMFNNLHTLKVNDMLVKSAEIGFLKGVDYALKHGAKIHYNDDEPLRTASNNNNVEIVKFLIEKGAKIKIDFNIVFYNACEFSEFELADYLIKKGVDLHSESEYALRQSAETGNLEAVKYLIDKGADIHSDDDYAFRYAIENDHLNVVEFLNNKYNFIKNKYNKNKYLDLAVSNNAHSVIEYLINIIDINIINNINKRYKNDYYTDKETKELLKSKLIDNDKEV